LTKGDQCAVFQAGQQTGFIRLGIIEAVHAADFELVERNKRLRLVWRLRAAGDTCSDQIDLAGRHRAADQDQELGKVPAADVFVFAQIDREVFAPSGLAGRVPAIGKNRFSGRWHG
jgi:hypothetical protein